MNISNAQRQVSEINTLQSSKYGHVIEITTPALFNRLEKASSGQYASKDHNVILPVKKCLAIKITCKELDDVTVNDDISNLILEITLPFNYPQQVLNHDNINAYMDNEPTINLSGLEKKISTYLESFTGCDCLELIIDWLLDNKETCIESPSSSCWVYDKGNNKLTPPAGTVECYILRYNHLLQGPEHKKEKNMVDTAKKSRLQGGIYWGTPGLVILVPPSTIDDAKEYASDCRDIGKRSDVVESMYLPKNGLEEAGLGGLAQQKRGGKLKDMDSSILRLACGGEEDLVRSVLGVK